MRPLVSAAIALVVMASGAVVLSYFSSRTRTRETIHKARSSALVATHSRSGPGVVRGSGEMSEEVEARHPDPAEIVLSYREQQFRDVLGFSFEASIILAESKADWHEAEALLKAGCPKHIVLNLLT